MAKNGNIPHFYNPQTGKSQMEMPTSEDAVAVREGSSTEGEEKESGSVAQTKKKCGVVRSQFVSICWRS